MNRIPVLLLTGFLGSGKTTILNRLLAHKDFHDTAVIINEVGTVGVDHLLVEQGTEDVTLLEGGCMCCGARGSLSLALHRLMNRRRESTEMPFQRVILETSGLADPQPILQSLIADGGFNRYAVPSGLVTVVDAFAAAHTLDAHPQAVSQVALADLLLITKKDLVTPRARDQIESRLLSINQGAPRIDVRFGDVDPTRVWLEKFGVASSWRSCGEEDSSTEAATFVSASRMFEGQLAREQLEYWLEHTMALFGPSLLRFKGVLNVVESGAPVVIHGVQNFVHSPGTLKEWPAGARMNRMVLIGHDIDRQLLEDALTNLTKLARNEGPAKPCFAGPGAFAKQAYAE